MNRLKPDQPLVKGTRVKIPGGRSSASPEVQEPIHSSVIQDNIIEYVVREGDSIWAIAEKFKTNVKVIQSLNQLATTELTAGQVLVVTENPEFLKKLKTVKYKVQKGDSPYSIAKKHRMKTDDFLKLNRLDTNAQLMPGDLLQVKAR
jgi:membrane-bound lytic murein transglycosylase D